MDNLSYIDFWQIIKTKSQLKMWIFKSYLKSEIDVVVVAIRLLTMTCLSCVLRPLSSALSLFLFRQGCFYNIHRQWQLYWPKKPGFFVAFHVTYRFICVHKKNGIHISLLSDYCMIEKKEKKMFYHIVWTFYPIVMDEFYPTYVMMQFKRWASMKSAFPWLHL